MNLRYLKAVGLIASPLLLTGCIDNNYDLDDIDTTTRITVNDLVVPLQLQEIQLENILKLEENENIKVLTVNGRTIYALEKSGTIETDKVSINPLHVNAPAIAPTKVELTGHPFVWGAPAKRAGSDMFVFGYDVNSPMLADFSLNAENIDEALLSLTMVESVDPISFSVTFSLPQEVVKMVKKVAFQDIKVQLPKGLMLRDGVPATASVGTYDPKTGLLTIDSEVPLDGNRIDIRITAGRLDTETAGIHIVDHAIRLSGQVGMLAGGSIHFSPGDLTMPEQYPSTLELRGDYALSSFNVAAFSGRIDYAVKGIDIAPISLSDLPDFLNSPSTQVIVDNPQIYLSALNTTAHYNTSLSGALSLNSLFSDNQATNHLSPSFTIGYNRGVAFYNIAMAADTDRLDLSSTYPDSQKIGFPGLRELLAAPSPAGLPKQITVALDNLRFHGDAVNFPIRHSATSSEGQIDAMRGEYTFFAPLAFGEGSKVIYSKQERDFGDDDLDKLNIKYLDVTAHAATNIPFEVQLTLTPLDHDGKAIGHTVQNIVLPPNADQDIRLRVDALPGGTINHLDGVDYSATILCTEQDAEAISPDMTIGLTNLRLTVNGYYETDF